jgi:hypothetical protein
MTLILRFPHGPGKRESNLRPVFYSMNFYFYEIKFAKFLLIGRLARSNKAREPNQELSHSGLNHRALNPFRASSRRSLEVHEGHVDADFSRQMHKGAHQEHEREDEHRRHDPPMPYAQKPREKGEN